MIYDAALDESKPPYEQQGLPSEEVTIAEILKEGVCNLPYWEVAFGSTGWHGPARAGFRSKLVNGSGLFLPEDDPTW